jgi:hypothetical protein
VEEKTPRNRKHKPVRLSSVAGTWEAADERRCGQRQGAEEARKSPENQEGDVPIPQGDTDERKLSKVRRSPDSGPRGPQGNTVILVRKEKARRSRSEIRAGNGEGL